MKSISYVVTRYIVSAIILNVLFACGSSSGGDKNTPQFANRAPVVNLDADFSAVELTTVVLDGSASRDGDGSINNYTWRQTAGSPVVSLNNASLAVANFLAPAVTSNTALTFELTVTDDDGAVSTNTLTVTITADQPPSVVLPNDFDAIELLTTTLDGSGSSDDVAIISYLWQQVSGQSVVLMNANSASASFDAPAFNASQTLLMAFRLTVTDSTGATATDTVDVTIIETPAEITLSGKLSFDLITHNNVDGLDYNNITQANIRGATVELLDASNSTILDTVVSDANGDYSFVVAASSNYVVRVKAELKQLGATPSWDFSVVDNTNGKALYVMDSATQNMNITSMVIDLNAGSGWTGSGYTQTRVAAPFAILDSVYKTKEKIVAADPAIALPALKLNWSVNNVNVEGDTTLGQIITSHFNGSEIYILGSADSDTDEYDDHVIIHEWAHYFEGVLSRSDSIGGSHGAGDKLDLRVALGEGFGNAFSAIITDDPFYRDSFGVNQSLYFNINVETNPTDSNKGWFSESSIQSLIYDLYDSNDDGSDVISLGFTPLYQVLVGGEKNTEAFTSIYSFINQLKIISPGNAVAIDSLLLSQDIRVNDDFATGETNHGGDARNLPIYQSLVIGGGSVEVCSYGSNGQFNKLGNRKLLIFDIATTASYSFTLLAKSVGGDPDMSAYKQGQLVFLADTSTSVNESVSQTLSSGKYVLEVYDYNNIEGAVKNSCIDVTLTAN